MQLRRFDAINVVPFIDIMLVLLVIVLTTSTFVARGMIPVDLSKAGSSDALQIHKELIITITKEGKYFFNDVAVESSALKEALTKVEKESTVFINCDKASSFEPFVHILNLLKENNFTKLSVVTQQ
ncbi:MAG: biopolymer transporter ExbD [Sulfurospirillaceae bacterium]|nr:biopolymer transporter ExbD [Sulfurospirillaceae bacterium]MDD2825699.1 biopolymer transporter ExbD [Sulfurospirillaceae bacterium]